MRIEAVYDVIVNALEDVVSIYSRKISPLQKPDLTSAITNVHPLACKGLFGLSNNKTVRDVYQMLCNLVGSQPAIEDADNSWMEDYVRTFCRRWNAYLDDDEEMHGKIHVHPLGYQIIVEFFPVDKGDAWDIKPQYNQWDFIAKQFTDFPYTFSSSGILIRKPNFKHFWTEAVAREDSDATLCKQMLATMPKNGE